MKVLICGSRTPKDPFATSVTISEIVKRLEPGMIVLNGGAPGVDQMVERAIRQNKKNVVHDLGTDWGKPWRPVTDAVTCVIYRADWKQHGKAAGPIRNLHMLDQQPKLVLALWNGTSPGTAQVVDAAQHRRIETHILDA